MSEIIYLSREEAFVDEYSTLDIEKEIDQLNPTLWKAVNMLTRSASERNGRQTTSSRQKHDKSLRNYFLLCSLMFCANNQCSMPLHILVADLVESQGGTAFLIKALNKWVCVHLRTHLMTCYQINLFIEINYTFTM